MNKKFFISGSIMLLSLFIFVIIAIIINNKFDMQEKIYFEKVDGNLYKVVNNSELSNFDSEYQELIDFKIEQLLKKKYNFDGPLMILNPYGTNTLGVNIYFNTNEELEIFYVVSVDNEEIFDFSRVLKNDSEDNFAREHRYQIIGLIPGEINNLKLVGINRNGERQEVNLTLDMSSVECESSNVLNTSKGVSVQELAAGLFVVFSSGKPNNIYDNNGVLRASLVLEEELCYRIIFYNGELYYKYDENIIGVIDRMGRIKKEYVVPTHRLHHDYIFDEDNMKMISLATSYEEQESRVGDFIVVIDLSSGEVEKVIDMKDLLPEMYEIAKNSSSKQFYFYGQGLSWIHLNSLSLVDGKSDVIVSSRELSSIIYLEDVYNEPKVKYLIADEAIYEGTSYSELVLEKKGDFVSQASQHTVDYLSDDSLEEGQYYLSMFNNNWGENYSRDDFPWYKYPGVGSYFEGEKSMYYKYLVDENEGSYELVDVIDVDYSSVESSSYNIGDNYVIASNKEYCFGEYDRDGELIRKFGLSMDGNGPYRVFKYDFNGVWFK